MTENEILELASHIKCDVHSLTAENLKDLGIPEPEKKDIWWDYIAERRWKIEARFRLKVAIDMAGEIENGLSDFIKRIQHETT